MKRQRILTNRNYPLSSYETIERDNKGNYYWYAKDNTINAEACFPVDLEFVKDKFRDNGRDFNSNI